MKLRVGVRIPLFDFGWLRLSFQNIVDIRKLSLVISRPVPIPSNDLSVLTKGEINRGAIQRITWSQHIAKPHITRNSLSIKLQYLSAEHSVPAYWRTLELIMNSDAKCIDLRELVTILRPRVMAQLAQTEAIELEVELSREIDNPRSIMSSIRVSYLFPIFGTLRRICTYKVRSTMGKPTIIRALENYMLASPKYIDEKILQEARIIRNDKSLTMLGRILALALMPYMLNEEDLNTIETICKCEQ